MRDFKVECLVKAMDQKRDVEVMFGLHPVPDMRRGDRAWIGTEEEGWGGLGVAGRRVGVG